MALSWVLSHRNTVAIPGASSAEQVTQNAEAADLTLAEDDIVRLGDIAAGLGLRGGIGGAAEAMRR